MTGTIEVGRIALPRNSDLTNFFGGRTVAEGVAYLIVWICQQQPDPQQEPSWRPVSTTDIVAIIKELASTEEGIWRLPQTFRSNQNEWTRLVREGGEILKTDEWVTTTDGIGGDFTMQATEAFKRQLLRLVE